MANDCGINNLQICQKIAACKFVRRKMIDSENGSSKCPICNAAVPSVGIALSDPITDHFRSGLCTPESYEFDVLDLSAFLPMNIFVLLDVLGRMPKLRHLWLKLPCPISHRPAATVYERFTSMLYQETSLKKHVSDSNFLSRLGFHSSSKLKPEIESQSTLRSSSVQFSYASKKESIFMKSIGSGATLESPSNPVSLDSEKVKGGDIYEVLIRSLNHVNIRSALLQVPFEELTEFSRLLISFIKIKEITDSTHEIDLTNILAQGEIFLSEGMLLARLRQKLEGIMLAVDQRVAEPSRLSSELFDGCISAGQIGGTDPHRSTSFSTFSYEPNNDLSSSINFGESERKTPTNTCLQKMVYVAPPNESVSSEAPNNQGTCFEPLQPSQHSVEVTAHNNGELSEQEFGLNRFVSARAFMGHSPLDDCTAEQTEEDDDNFARTSIEQANASPNVLRQSRSFLSYVLQSIVRQFKGEDTTSKYSILSGLFDSIRYDLPTIVVRRLMSIGTRKDYLALLAALLPSLQSIDGINITPQKRHEYIKEVQDCYSFPHYLMFRWTDKNKVYLRKKNGKSNKAHLNKQEVSLQERKRLSIKVQELEGQQCRHCLGSAIPPLDYPLRTAKKVCAWHISHVIEPRSYSIFNVYPINTPFRLSTTPPELPIESTFSLMSRFGRPNVLCSSPFGPDVAIGTDQGDVFVVDGTVPLCEAMHRYVTVIDSYKRDYIVDIPCMRRVKAGRHQQDSTSAITWMTTSPDVVVAATYYGELLFGHMLYDYAYTSTYRQRLKSNSIDIGRNILDFSLNSSTDETYTVSGSALRIVNYDHCSLTADILIDQIPDLLSDNVATRLVKCSYSSPFSLLGLGTSSGRIALYDTRILTANTKPVLLLNKFGGLPVESIAFSSNGYVLLSAALDGRVLHCDIRGAQSNCAASIYNISSIRSASNHTKAMFTHRCKKFLVSQHETGMLKLFDYPSGKQFHEIYMNPPLKRNTTNLIDFDEIPSIPFTYSCITKTNTIYDVSVISLINDAKDSIRLK